MADKDALKANLTQLLDNYPDIVKLSEEEIDSLDDLTVKEIKEIAAMPGEKGEPEIKPASIVTVSVLVWATLQ